MLASKYQTLIDVSMLYLARQSIRQRCLATFSRFPQSSAVAKTSRTPQIVKEKRDDPNVFGTLASRRHPHLYTEPLVSDQLVDEGDAKEEEYLSFEPLEKRKVEEVESEIKHLIDGGQLKDALHLLEVEMKEERVKPSRNIYSLLIGACGRAGYTKKAFQLYNDMKKRGFQPTGSQITSLFNSCANSPWPADGLGRANKLRQQLADKNMLLNSANYHAMIKAFGHCGDITTCLQIVDEMAAKQLVITTETFNFLLHASVSLPKDGFNHAILIWRKMRNQSVTPDQFSYKLMLRVTRDCGVGDMIAQQPLSSLLLTEGEAVPSLPAADNGPTRLRPPSELTTSPPSPIADVPNLLARRIQPSNIVALTNLDLPENRLGLLGDVDGFLAEMEKDYSKPDIKTFTLLLETMASNTAQEKHLLDLMENLKIMPDVDFFNLLIKKRQYRREYPEAKEVLGHLQHYQLFPNIMTFGVLALGCTSLKEANQLLDSMEESGFRVNNQIFGSLLKNATHRKDNWYVLELLRKAVRMNLTLDEKAIKVLHHFKRETMEQLAKHDRGEKVPHRCYSSPDFREGFRQFCLNFKSCMSKLEVALEPHPWAQHRYAKSSDDSDPGNQPCRETGE